MELSGCVGLVTGGAVGIGAAITADLRSAGARVLIDDRAGADVVTDLSEARRRPANDRRRRRAAAWSTSRRLPAG
jgi:NAD(P)-dependent dehydrogenase (short-subunit alcohol dehydrogenase family)